MAPLLLLLALGAQDPVQVGARLTEPEVRAGETTVLRVDVETEGARARISRFQSLPPGIEVVSTRDYDQRQFSLPGGTRRFITREFVLRASSPGRYRIPGLEVVVDGRVYTTRSRLLTVTAAATRAPGEPAGGDDGVALRAWLDADTVFVGQQVTLEVEAVFSTAARMRLRRAPEYEPPAPSGFWVHDLPDPGRPVRRSIGGDVYEVQQFRRAFFPLGPGEYTIPPARLEYEMRRGLLYAPESQATLSDSLSLVVRPLPEDRPPAFTGAVGDYTLRARVEPSTVPVGEAAVLTVEVEGVGNVKALPAPELPPIPGVEAFEPSEESDSEARAGVIQGRKTFQWVLIPRQAGELEVPSIRYAFFDPAEGAYVTRAAPALTFTATPAASGTETPAGEPSAATIRFLKTEPNVDPLGFTRSPWFAGLQGLPLLLLAGALLWRRRRRRPDRVSARALRREREQTLQRLRARAGREPDPDLFGDAERFARRWMARRLGLPEAVGADALVAHGISQDVAGHVRTALTRLAAARFAPEPPDRAAASAVIDALAEALQEMDRAAPPSAITGRRSRGRTAGTGAVLVLVLAGIAGPGTAQTERSTTETGNGAPQTATTESFAAGLQAFEAGRNAAAAERFERYVRRVPRDPAGWYNLGTSYYRAGRPGPAVQAWLWALRLDPRDQDAAHNLRVADVSPELVQRVTPPVPLRPSELLLLAAALWILGGFAGALWLVRQPRGSGPLAAGAVAAALAVAAVWWGSTRGGETLIVLDDAALRTGPALQAESVVRLEPGTGLVPMDRYGAWTRARTLRGEEGWIETQRTGSL